jgi:uncharacterized protein (UPF0248 family)
MEPIQNLLNRIRWDPAFGRADFVLGYQDHAAPTLVQVPLTRIRFDPESPGAFDVIGDDGVVRGIPLHRVREVSRNGELIWQRRT